MFSQVITATAFIISHTVPTFKRLKSLSQETRFVHSSHGIIASFELEGTLKV